VKIRLVPTASGSAAVQVVRYSGSRTVVLKHIGSGKSREDIRALKQLAGDWIEQQSGQKRLFRWPEEDSGDRLLGKYRYLGFRYGLIATTVLAVLRRFGLKPDSFPSASLFLNLVLARIVAPGSKRQARELLASGFGISYSLTAIYAALPELAGKQSLIERRLIAFAKANLGFDFSFVLYDMTTLYFETFKGDRLRRIGFSKDNKPGQPQILVGLIVDRSGFPLAFSVFPGSRFEGSTLIPVILGFKRKYRVDNLTVVADAAMISQANVLALKKAGLSYIVGARMANASLEIISQVSRQLNRVDGARLKLHTTDGFLICHFSRSRYHKDKHERQKQLDKAGQIIQGRRPPGRNRFLLKQPAAAYSLNTGLVKKSKLLLGIKGYHTNLNLPEKLVIERYRELWQVEKAFRLSKADLAARPVYHFKSRAITAHLLICVTALAVLKWLEITTGKPAGYVVDKLKSITDARLLNLVTGKETLLRAEIPGETSLMLKKIRPH